MIPDEFVRFSWGQQSRPIMRNVHGMLEDLTFIWLRLYITAIPILKTLHIFFMLQINEK